MNYINFIKRTLHKENQCCYVLLQFLPLISLQNLTFQQSKETVSHHHLHQHKENQLKNLYKVACFCKVSTLVYFIFRISVKVCVVAIG